MLARFYPRLAATVLTYVLSNLSNAFSAGPDQGAKVRQVVDEAMKPLIEQYEIPDWPSP
ncbi:hypothetical protein AB4Y97_18920 [Microvirga sp. 2TAF3]